MADAKRREIPEGEELAKRKPEAESAADLEEIEVKKARIESVPDLILGNEDRDRSGDESNGISAVPSVDKGKGVAIAVDKGKGKMVVEDEEDDDSDADEDDGDAGLGEDYESDLSDDPLAEVDLSNILPSRTRRREPPLPGAYLVNEEDDDDEDDDAEVSD